VPQPYRKAEVARERPADRKLAADDLTLALIVGPLGILLAVSADGALGLTFGLLLIALAVLVLVAARRALRTAP
jgi:hypothetical protein